MPQARGDPEAPRRCSPWRACGVYLVDDGEVYGRGIADLVRAPGGNLAYERTIDSGGWYRWSPVRAIAGTVRGCEGRY